MTMFQNSCLISLSNERGAYIKAQNRLAQSLAGKFDGDILLFQGEESVGAPKHIDNPYAFKVYAWLEAIKRGYRFILWVDSSCFAIKNVQPCFDEIENNGYIMQSAGHMVGTWTNDRTLEYFNVTRDEAMLMPMYGNAGFLGLDMENETAKKFITRWTNALAWGCFKGSWTNVGNTESMDERCKGHRHDMSAGSIIANQLGMKYQAGDEWLQYAGVDDEVLNETIIWKAQGM